MPDLIAGRVHFYVSPTIGVVPPYQAKQLKILGVDQSRSGSRACPTCRRSRRRASTTCATASSASARAKARRRPIVDLLNRHIVSIVATPDYRELIEKGGSLPESSNPAGLGQVIAQTVDDVAATIREFGMQQE